MLSRRITAGRPLLRAAIESSARQLPTIQQRCISNAEFDKIDPGMNGGYVNPPAIKRQFRDPYGDWWDKQERRNYGEIRHEDDDIMGVFSPHEYTFAPPGKAAFQVGCFIMTVFALCGIVSMTYPDRPSAPKEYEGGLEAELGGPSTVRARAPGDIETPKF